MTKFQLLKKLHDALSGAMMSFEEAIKADKIDDAKYYELRIDAIIEIMFDLTNDNLKK